MKKMSSIIIALSLLAACETNEADKEAIKAQVKEDAQTAQNNAEKHSMRVLNNVRDQTKKTAMKMREWWLTPLPEPVYPALKPSYCYKVFQDITCYRQPVPGKEHQLVGYQGDGVTNSPVAQTLALPTVEKEKQLVGTPEARAKTARPVFVTPPTAIKENKSGSAADEAAALGNEPLPNPLLSPQL